MSRDTANDMPRSQADVRKDVIIAGHTGDVEFVRAHLSHPDGLVRASVLTALDRLGELEDSMLQSHTGDPDPAVRRRVAELAAHRVRLDVMDLLHDEVDLVVEMAAWACGEQFGEESLAETNGGIALGRIITRLVELAGSHGNALVRESAIAALGSIGDERGLPAILAGCADKPAVRRRAVLALAPFAGNDVDTALRRALRDRDWQVRQAAEDVLGPEASSGSDAVDDQQNPEEDEERR